jgi:hypothetical protein
MVDLNGPCPHLAPPNHAFLPEPAELLPRRSGIAQIRPPSNAALTADGLVTAYQTLSCLGTKPPPWPVGEAARPIRRGSNAGWYCLYQCNVGNLKVGDLAMHGFAHFIPSVQPKSQIPQQTAIARPVILCHTWRFPAEHWSGCGGLSTGTEDHCDGADSRKQPSSCGRSYLGAVWRAITVTRGRLTVPLSWMLCPVTMDSVWPSKIPVRRFCGDLKLV